MTTPRGYNSYDIEPGSEWDLEGALKDAVKVQTRIGTIISGAEYNYYDPDTGELVGASRDAPIPATKREQYDYKVNLLNQVGEFIGDNGKRYEIKSNTNQSNTTITEAETQIDVYRGLTSAGGGTVANLPTDYKQTEAAAFASAELWQLSNNDLAAAQGKLQEAVAGGNLQDPTYGTGIPSGADLPAGAFGITETSDPTFGTGIPSGADLPAGSFGISAAGEEQAKKNREEFNKAKEQVKPNESLKFGKVDKIIKKLHLRNLIYPIDADFGNTQDYMVINQFKYRAPNQDIFFPQSQEAKNKARTNPSQIGQKGVPTGSPQEEFLGLVKLPMPNSLADSNNVSWGTDQLNALTAAVASGVFGKTNAAAEAISNIINNDPKNNPGFGLGKIQQILDETFGLVRGVARDTKTETRTLLDELVRPGTNLNTLGSAVAGSALLNILQFGVSPETILARGQGVVPNNNLALLFNSPTLREFTFTWKMTPRSREEAQRVNNIIRFFKQGMAPKKAIGTQTGAASYFLGTPNVFDISFKTSKKGGNFFFEGDDINHSVVRIKTCACTGATVNYTPDGMWNAYERGQPVSVIMSLRFSELEPIFDIDYDENVFNYDPNRKDLQPVPIDAVGY